MDERGGLREGRLMDKKGAVLEQPVVDNPGSWEAEVLALDPEERDCLFKSGVPLPLTLAGVATDAVELFAGEAPFCCKASSLKVRSLTASCNCAISPFCLSDTQLWHKNGVLAVLSRSNLRLVKPAHHLWYHSRQSAPSQKIASCPTTPSLVSTIPRRQMG